MMVGAARSLSARKKCSAPRPTSRSDSPRALCELIIRAIANSAGRAATHLRQGCRGTIAQEMMITEAKTDAISSALTARIEIRADCSWAGAGRSAAGFSSIFLGSLKFACLVETTINTLGVGYRYSTGSVSDLSVDQLA